MGAGIALGLLFEVNADPSHADAALNLLGDEVAKFAAQTLGISERTFSEYGAAATAAAKDLAELGGALGAVGGALLGAADHATHYAEEIGHAAERSGASAEGVLTLRFAAQEAGVGFDRVGQSLTIFAHNLGTVAETGKGPAAAALLDLGISLDDARVKTGNVSALLPDVIDRLAHMEAGGRRTAAMLALFGRGGGALIPMLSQFAGAMASVTARAEALGLVMHEKDVEAAHLFLEAQRTLTAELNALAVRIGSQLLPYLSELAIKLEHFPLLLRQIALQTEKTFAYLLALPTAGTSLLSLIPINKQIAAAQKEMNQAITDGVLQLERNAGAAALAAAETEKETNQTEKGAQAHTRAVQAVKQHTDALTNYAKSLAAAGPFETIMVERTQQLIPPLTELDAKTVQLSQDFLALLAPALQQATDKETVFTQATNDSGTAAEKSAQQQIQNEALALAQHLVNRKAYAAIEAIIQTAEGIADLAVMDYTGAALHFLSAAEYGLVAGGVGGGAGGAATAGRGGGGAGTAVNPANLTPAQQQTLLAPGAAGAYAPPPPGGALNVMIVGDQGAAKWMAQVLTPYVKAGGTLASSHTLNPPTVGR